MAHRPKSHPHRDPLVWVALAAAVLALCGHLLWSDRSATPSDPSLPRREGAATLADANLRPASAIDALERRIEAQAAEIGALRRRLEALGAGESEDPARADVAGQARTRAPRGAAPESGVTESTLLAAGFGERDARELNAAFEEIRLEQLFLRDHAARTQGQVGTEYSARLERLSEREDGILKDYGEDAYAWMLYAMGRPNRVAVREVIGSSPAAEAGLRAGDVVKRYEDRWIHDANDLKKATLAGDVGEWVDLEIEREGRTQRVRIPRGPLGVMLDVTSQRPTSE